MNESAITTVLVVTGAITAGAIVVGLAPRPAMRIIFGADRIDELSALIARHWGLLVALVGALLIYAGRHAELRTPVMIVAIVEKLAIAGLILSSSFKARPLALTIAATDSAFAVLYVVMLVTGSV